MDITDEQWEAGRSSIPEPERQGTTSFAPWASRRSPHRTPVALARRRTGGVYVATAGARTSSAASPGCCFRELVKCDE